MIILSSLLINWLKRLSTLAVAIISTYFGCAQSQITFQHISTVNGLSQNDVNTIFQDKYGFMWFGTHDGLNKYDGYSFTVFNPDNQQNESINSNLIFDITGDDEGNLWIGTTGSGLDFFNATTEKFQHFVHNPSDSKSLSNNAVTALLKDSKNRLWVGTRNGLNMLDLNSTSDKVEFRRFNSELSDPNSGWWGTAINTIYEDKNGQLFIGGVGGLFKLEKDNTGEEHFINLGLDKGLPRANVNDIAEASSGQLLIATAQGLYCQLKHVETFERFYSGSFNNILLDKDNAIWAGSDIGLFYFDSSSDKNLPELSQKFQYNPQDPTSLSKNVITSLYLDDSGIVWIGANGGGINTYDSGRKQFRHIKNTYQSKSLSYDKIRAMFEDSNGTLWIGTEGGGLNMLTKKNDDGSYANFEHFSSISKIFAITETKIGNSRKLLVGSERFPGLSLVDISNPNEISEADFVRQDLGKGNSVFSLLTDSRQNIWIGTYDAGIHRWIKSDTLGQYRKETFSYNPENSNSIASNIIRNIIEDRLGNIWFATGEGLCMLSIKERYKQQPRFVVYKNDRSDSKSLSHDYILSLYESVTGTIWVGTFGGGLSKLVPSRNDQPATFVNYSVHDGLPNNVIKGILEDNDGNLWLSTNNGLSKFNPEKETFNNYNTSDGLQDNEFQELACLKRSNGEMLFGGINGFNAFFPEDIKENTFPAPSVITDLLISNKSVKIGEKVRGRILLDQNIAESNAIELDYGMNNFSFEFAALHYAAPSKNQYAYILEGYDEDWTETLADKRFATYTNLEPGDYLFKVKASNNDGLWNTSPTELKIRIIPPWWRSSLAYSIYSILVLGILWLFWRYTIIRTSKKHLLELEHIEKEKSDEIQQMKLEFFTNISHEFRTPLTLIKGPLEYLQKNVDQLDRNSLKEQFGLMQKNTNYLLRLVGQLLDFRKITQGKMRLVMRNSNIVSFIKEVAEPFQFMAHKQSVYFILEAKNESVMAWFDHEALEKIMNNLLSNAFKFTAPGGKIKVKISESSKNKNEIIIKVKDSGIGISKTKISKIFERFHSAQDNSEINPEGVGIGLSFTKNLVELHQGKIEVSSKQNKGTKFIVKLPKNKEAYLNIDEISCKDISDSDFLVRSSETESFAIMLNDNLIDENLYKTRSKLPILLIVDDNPDIRTFIDSVLRKTYKIYEANNGKNGLELAKKIMPNVVICDILMPIMDGIEFTKKMKSKTETSHIPIIILTAKSSQESELQSLKLGVDEYLRKPFDIELLRLKLSNIIKRRDSLRKRFNREITLQPSDVVETSMDEEFLKQAISIVEKHMMNSDFNVEMMVKEMGLSRTTLYLKFKELTGLTSTEFIRNVRLKRAVQLFDKSDYSVKEIMFRTGFNTASYFSKCFKKQFGVSPSEYVKKIGKRSVSTKT